jgi:3,4-dihydroxy-2-butanone 4-phosphate synthase
MTFPKIEHTLTAIRSGEWVVVVDDAGREMRQRRALARCCCRPKHELTRRTS